MSTLALMGVLRELAPGYEKATGTRIAPAFAPTAALAGRIGAGEAADVAVLTAAGIDELARDGTLAPGGRVDLARSVVGVAVRAGAPKPDIGSPEGHCQIWQVKPVLGHSAAIQAIANPLGL